MISSLLYSRQSHGLHRPPDHLQDVVEGQLRHEPPGAPEQPDVKQDTNAHFQYLWLIIQVLRMYESKSLSFTLVHISVCAQYRLDEKTLTGFFPNGKASHAAELKARVRERKQEEKGPQGRLRWRKCFELYRVIRV